MNPRLRALGRLLLFVLFALVLLPAKRRWLYATIHGSDETVGYLIDHAIELAAVLIYGWIAAAAERRPFAAFGLSWRQALRSSFWLGAGVGLVSLTVLVLALQAAGALRISPPSGPALAAAGFGVGYAVLFALLALREEYLYRGVGLFTLTLVVGFWPAAVASAAWFAGSHAGSASENAIGLANVAIYGMLACLVLRRTGSLWMPIGFHASWNWGQTYLFGVSDSGHPAPPGHLLTATVPPGAPAWLSGGSVGPEGSLLCAVILVLLWIACARLLRGVRYPSLETRRGS
ncbi:MAG TPA: CPBP family intramembrane glutamic endopeptidase [Candidatus Eisenbacteria bacterium]